MYFGNKVAKMQWIIFNPFIYLYKDVCASQVLVCELLHPFCSNMVKFQGYFFLPLQYRHEDFLECYVLQGQQNIVFFPWSGKENIPGP